MGFYFSFYKRRERKLFVKIRFDLMDRVYRRD